MPTFASMVWFLVVSKVRNTLSGSVLPDSGTTLDAVNGWLNTMSKYTVYSWDCPSLSDSPQKSPEVTLPDNSSFPTTVALVAESPFWLASSLTRKSAWVVDGNVNWPIELCGVAANCEVIGFARFDSAL